MSNDWDKGLSKVQPETAGAYDRKDSLPGNLSKTVGKIRRKVTGRASNAAMARKNKEHEFEGKAQAKSSLGEQKITDSPKQ